MSDVKGELSKFWCHAELVNHLDGCESGAYVITKDELAFLMDKNAEQENQRLTAIATKHATRADALYEALEGLTLALNEEWEHSKLVHEKMESAFEVLDKSRIEAEKDDGICN